MAIDLIDPEGRLRSVEDKDLAQAQAQGYRVPTGQEAWAGEHPLGATLLGGVRALPFGETALQARGEALGISPEVNAATLRALETQNPRADLAGAAIGTLGMAALTGPLTTGVKTAALEGGLYGLSQVIDEGAIENRGATLEEMAAGSLRGALMGGTLAGGVKLAGFAAKKFAAPRLVERMTEKADEMEWAALTKGNNASRRVTPEMQEEILAAAREAGVTGKLLGAIDEDALQAATKVRDRAQAELQKAVDSVDATKFTPEVLSARVTNRIWDVMEEAGVNRNPTLAKYMDSAAEKRLRNEVDALRTVQDLQKWADGTLTKLAASKTMKGEIAKLRLQAVQEVLDDVTKGTYKTALKKLNSAKKLTEFLDYQVTNAGAFTDINAARAIAGAAGFGVGGPAGAVAAAAIAPVLSKRAGLFGAAALRSMATPSSLAAGLLKRASVVTAPFMAMARQRLERAAAESPDRALAEHVALAREPDGARYLGALGLMPETDSEAVAASERLAALDGLNAMGEARNERWEASTSALLRGEKLASTPPSGDFESKKTALKAFLNDAEQHFATNGVPGASAEALGMAVNAARYLEGRLPKDPYQGPDSLRRPFEPSPADRQKWLRYAEAVEDPQNVLIRMSNGTLLPEHVEAFQAAYPTLYADLQSKLYEALHVWDKPVNYRTKLQLGLFFGPKAFGLDQDVMQVLQAAQAIDSEPQNGSMSPDGRQKVSVSRNLETQAQRLQGR